ncbi:hypothetical protein ABEB22_19815 (plasmid) [Thioclava sp. 'Guangxiensis']|uniref:hypothetical protein n=1 Tax=Thioclava sp. 'Guangxiensis' TaxID=3149044 RepID=UPI003877D202
MLLDTDGKRGHDSWPVASDLEQRKVSILTGCEAALREQTTQGCKPRHHGEDD